MGVGRLCMLFGKTRQAYYDKERFVQQEQQDQMIVLEMVAGIRRELPGLGVHKLHWMLGQPLRTNGIKMGRDKLNDLLRRNDLLVRKRKRRSPRTTESYHRFKKYPNLIKDLVVSRVEEVWVSDITYICVGNDFNYLFLITDAYSHMIIGHCLHSLLANDGALIALEMALKSRTNKTLGLIHHSDRGVQYCSFDYIRTLMEQGVGVSMTEGGDAYENAMAERVNGILKTEFHLDKLFKSRSDALLAVEKAVSAYNQLRPHMSCGYLTPAQAHTTTQELIKRWKPKKHTKTVGKMSE